MDTRRIERTGWDVSVLSFGCMRFADDESAAAAVKQAFASGVSYFDVAPGYGSGTAEPRLGAGLKGLPRDQVYVTAKSSPGNGGTGVGVDYRPEVGFGIRSAAQARTEIERSMGIIGVDHLDMYHLWACHGDAVFEEAMKPGGFLDGVTAAREEGLFDHIGLTTHMDGPGIIRYLQRFEFDAITIPYHLRDTSRTDAVAYCAARGIGVIAMNPLAGGALAKPSPVLQRIAQDHGLSSMVEAALRYLISLPGVTTALAGITYDHQAVEDAAAVSAGTLPADMVASLYQRVHELYANVEHFCSACGYCGECPQGLVIPAVLEMYSNALVPSVAEDALLLLAERLQANPESYDPALCSACKQCEEKCPNKLPVSDLMAKAAVVAEGMKSN
jgi:uncharacterized protein